MRNPSGQRLWKVTAIVYCLSAWRNCKIVGRGQSRARGTPDSRDFAKRELGNLLPDSPGVDGSREAFNLSGQTIKRELFPSTYCVYRQRFGYFARRPHSTLLKRWGEESDTHSSNIYQTNASVTHTLFRHVSRVLQAVDGANLIAKLVKTNIPSCVNKFAICKLQANASHIWTYGWKYLCNLFLYINTVK